jgi:hypothetical protein
METRCRADAYDAAKVMRIVKGELKTTEGANNDNKYGRALHQNKVFWCSLFVSFCMKDAGFGLFYPVTASTRTSYAFYKGKKWLVPRAEARPGDIVWFYFCCRSKLVNHVGFVTRNPATAGWRQSRATRMARRPSTACGRTPTRRSPLWLSAVPAAAVPSTWPDWSLSRARPSSGRQRPQRRGDPEESEQIPQARHPSYQGLRRRHRAGADQVAAQPSGPGGQHRRGRPRDLGDAPGPCVLGDPQGRKQGEGRSAAQAGAEQISPERARHQQPNFGPETERVVRNWQKHRGQRVDGVVDMITWYWMHAPKDIRPPNLHPRP